MKLSEYEFSQALKWALKFTTNHFKIEKGIITIGEPSEINDVSKKELLQILEKFKPFRKGPFNLFGIQIQANWKSNIKLERLTNYITEFKLVNHKSRVCDIGCNNGYFLAGLQPLQSTRLIGLDPTHEFYQFYRFINTLCPILDSEFLPYGYDALQRFESYFHLAICMGLLYHVTDPMALLKIIYKSLVPKGFILIETIMHESSKNYPVSLIPGGKYVGMRGVWNVPDKDSVLHWLKRSGFHHIQFLDSHTYLEEQVRTEWGDLPALSEMLADDGNATIEGYPPPQRAWFLAKK